jgi:hypothetical protein
MSAHSKQLSCAGDSGGAPVAQIGCSWITLLRPVRSRRVRGAFGLGGFGVLSFADCGWCWFRSGCEVQLAVIRRFREAGGCSTCAAEIDIGFERHIFR